ncbi:oligopeptide transport system permease protein [Paraburkholderia sp. Clong3]|uniref:Oligopeptide transport system permease protein n=1 Tax=Paraburkholderia tuberum TaxID=157910 RepID=A0A1H0ZZ94_9BURK|nr:MULTISPECIES: ABC transporter permease subunit [Paraburkholderia]MBB5443586.1 oligopeptide transport system permease protein [Paraburkholderia sp. WSM4177]MBB5466604.1 oligopeptide transport system permease protein [Paraburkholderia sp. CI2]MBB5484193.1 oligopeptide transport system permease protein [Paraburkholderia sp. WSM4180]MDH6150980.1 oligopeptide transport system permease protein [Paraburkholderia sp. WSM4179]SDQ32719.1 oligopeptide transport system permease protein [Paraburkholderi
MLAYTLRRALWAIPTILAVITACYLLLHLTPGGPFDSEKHLSAAVLANLDAKYHIDQPLWKQYLLYIDSLLHGDLGASFRYTDWSVSELVWKALPVSLGVGGISVPIALVIGVALGTVAAVRRNGVIDYGVMLLGNLGSVVPPFILGPVLVWVFAILIKRGEHGLLPAGGWGDGDWHYRVLPIVLLVIINVSTIARVMRGSMIEVLSGNFIRTARAKGLAGRTIVLRHALKPALMPVVSLLGSLCISSITAAVVTESVFALPGLGQLVVNGAINRDYTLVLGLVALITAFAVLFNLLVDLAYAWLDPRIRY